MRTALSCPEAALSLGQLQDEVSELGAGSCQMGSGPKTGNPRQICLRPVRRGPREGFRELCVNLALHVCSGAAVSLREKEG